MKNNDKLAKIAINKSLLKEYLNSSDERIVYLNNNTEFQIQIFNPYSYVIGVSFEFNDNANFNRQLLVIKPGERIWLDRYLDNESKLLFSTYEVNNTNEVKEAIKNNGKLVIKFYKERIIDWYNNYIYAVDNNYNNNYDSYYNNERNLFSTSVASYTATLGSSINSITSSTAPLTSATYSSTSTIDGGNVKIGTNSKLKSKSIETGRIEKGSHSNQNFNYVNKDFESLAFKTEIIQLLPMSQKHVTSNDLYRKYCYNCGRKLSSKYKFCPFCGAGQ